MQGILVIGGTITILGGLIVIGLAVVWIGNKISSPPKYRMYKV